MNERVKENKRLQHYENEGQYICIKWSKFYCVFFFTLVVDYIVSQKVKWKHYKGYDYTKNETV